MESGLPSDLSTLHINPGFVVKVESTIFANDYVDGPETGNVVAPPCRSACDGNNMNSGVVESPQGAKGFG